MKISSVCRGVRSCCCQPPCAAGITPGHRARAPSPPRAPEHGCHCALVPSMCTRLCRLLRARTGLPARPVLPVSERNISGVRVTRGPPAPCGVAGGLAGRSPSCLPSLRAAQERDGPAGGRTFSRLPLRSSAAERLWRSGRNRGRRREGDERADGSVLKT